VSVRVSPTEKIRAGIHALFDGQRELGEVIEDAAQLGARLIIQTALEAEVEVFLGRARASRHIRSRAWLRLSVSSFVYPATRGWAVALQP
jgi:hypothetical protein